jgi:hypothetical protein
MAVMVVQVSILIHLGQQQLELAQAVIMQAVVVVR